MNLGPTTVTVWRREQWFKDAEDAKAALWARAAKTFPGFLDWRYKHMAYCRG